MLAVIVRERRCLRLPKLENVRLSLTFSPFVSSVSSKPFSSADSQSVEYGEESRKRLFTVSYLVDSCGLSRERAELISNKVSFEKSDRPDFICSIFRNWGFTEAHISKIVGVYPRILLANAEESLNPKLEFLQSKGASISDIVEMISRDPSFLTKSLQKAIIPCYGLLKSVLVDDAKVIKILRTHARFLVKGKHEMAVRSVSLLKKFGVPQSSISRLIVGNPGLLWGNDRLEELIKNIIQMGFDPKKHLFMVALHTMYQLSNESVERKLNLYKGLGLSEDEVWIAFKRWPACLRYSEEKITNTVEMYKRCGFSEDEIWSAFNKYPRYFNVSGQAISMKMNFLVKKMGWEPSAIAKAPVILTYSLEKRIIRRANVIRVLKSEGLLANEKSLTTFMNKNDKAFVEAFVNKYQDRVPHLIKVFNGECSLSELGLLS